jgi:putative ABC transport system permease protein
MNILRLSWRNLTHKPLSALLSILLFALSIGLISLLLNLRQQADEQFDNNLAGVDLVVGAKGSPLELVLNSMYHVGYATGNISLKEAKPFFNARNPIVADAIPLSVGDSYRGYRIVGTIPKILDWYGVELAEGESWRKDFSATIGAEVAAVHKLKIGDRFRSNHGIIDEGENNIEHDDDFIVVGILAESGTVMDQVVLTTNQTYWHSHEGHDVAAPEQEEHEGHVDGDDHPSHDDHADHEGHDHGEARDIDPLTNLLASDPEKQISSLLVRYKNASSFQALSFPRNINENTGMLAANPAYEINEVRRQFDSGQRILGILVLAITIVSSLSIFIALFSSLRERRYELALLRVLGSGRSRLFSLIILEGLLVAVIGYVLGILLSHFILTFIAGNVTDDFRVSLDAWRFLAEEGWLLVVALGIAFVAAVIPAIEAARTDIGDTLTA